MKASSQAHYHTREAHTALHRIRFFECSLKWRQLLIDVKRFDRINLLALQKFDGQQACDLWYVINEYRACPTKSFAAHRFGTGELHLVAQKVNQWAQGTPQRSHLLAIY